MLNTSCTDMCSMHEKISAGKVIPYGLDRWRLSNST